VTLDTGAKAEEGGKALPWMVLLYEFFLDDPVRLADDSNFLPGNLAEHPDRKAGSRERHPVLDLLWEPESACNLPDLILVEVADRFYDFRELHVERHAAHVVVALDPSLALDPVGIDRSLKQARCALLPGLAFEDPDEPLANRLPLGLGVRDPLQGIEELVAGIDNIEMDVAKDRPDAFGLPLTHQACVYVDRYQVVADRPGGKGCADRTVHAAG